MLKITPILFALLLLGCSKDKEPKLDCDSFCDDEKIKAWYQQKYGEPITEFELSAKSVLYETRRWRNCVTCHLPRDQVSCVISVARTATGIFEKCNKRIELSMEEWLHFIRELSKLRIHEWKKEYPIDTLCNGEAPCQPKLWRIEITSLDKNKSLKSFGSEIYPANWDGFQKAVYDIDQKISEKSSIIKAESKSKFFINKGEAIAVLRAEYQRKFGEPISDFELSTKEMNFSLKEPRRVELSRDLDKTNANAKVLFQDWVKVELSTEEWLDYVRALHKTRFYEWGKEYELKRKYGDEIHRDIEWQIKYGDKLSNSRSFSFATYPPSWTEFNKVIDDIAANVKYKESIKKDEEAVKKRDSESILIAEYQNRFGEPITEPELSTTRIYFKFEFDEYNSYSVGVGRYMFESNAKARFSSLSTNAKPFKKSFSEFINLSTEEWLDFVRALRKIRFYEWEQTYSDNKKHDGFKWNLSVVNWNNYDKNDPYKNRIEFSGTNAYPPNWDEFKKLMDDMEEKIKRNY